MRQKKLRLYEFKHAGVISSKSLSNALTQVVHHDPGEFPDLIENDDGAFDIFFGIKGYRDTFLGIKGEANYPRPQAYKPPPADYAGDDDWLWDDIMRHRNV